MPGAIGYDGKSLKPAEALAAMAPHEIDGTLEAWLPQRVAYSVKPEIRWRATRDGDPDCNESYIADWSVTGEFSEADIAAAVTLIELLSAPATPEYCAEELARLKLMVKERPQATEDMVLQIAVMAEELSCYPSDVVRDTCRTWAATNKFFPAWAELHAMAEERVLKRRCLLRALRALHREQTARPKIDKPDPYNKPWKACQEMLEKSTGTTAYRAWLRDLIPVVPEQGPEADYHQLGAPTRFIRDHIEREHKTAIEEALSRPVKLVLFNPRNHSHRAHRAGKQ